MKNRYNIPVSRLYSKKELLDMTKFIIEKYWSPVEGDWFNAIIVDNKLFAKQYPGKELYYLI